MTELRLRTHDLSWRELDGEIVALDGGQSLYLGTNTTGALLWQRLSSGATAEQLAAELVDQFGVAAEQARADVERFLADLRAHGLLEV